MQIFLFFGCHIQFVFVVESDREDRLANGHLVLHVHRDRVACQKPVQRVNVDIVVASAFPAHDAEVAAVVVRFLDDELELDLAEAAEPLVVELGLPDVALAPNGADTRFAVSCLRIPITKSRVAADDPELFAEISLVSHSNLDSLEASRPLVHGWPLRATGNGISECAHR